MTEPVRPRLVKSILSGTIFLVYAKREDYLDREWAVVVKPGPDSSLNTGQKLSGYWNTYEPYKGSVKDFLD